VSTLCVDVICTNCCKSRIANLRIRHLRYKRSMTDQYTEEVRSTSIQDNSCKIYAKCYLTSAPIPLLLIIYQWPITSKLYVHKSYFKFERPIITVHVWKYIHVLPKQIKIGHCGFMSFAVKNTVFMVKPIHSYNMGRGRILFLLFVFNGSWQEIVYDEVGLDIAYCLQEPGNLKFSLCKKQITYSTDKQNIGSRKDNAQAKHVEASFSSSMTSWLSSFFPLVSLTLCYMNRNMTK
jgi:hypothetical protein